jgi:hypothetical protein
MSECLVLGAVGADGDVILPALISRLKTDCELVKRIRYAAFHAPDR